jgi:signal transduction histidine kinase
MDMQRRDLRVSLDRAAPSVAFEMYGDARRGLGDLRLGNISRAGMFVEADLERGAPRIGDPIQFSIKLDDAGDDVTGVAKVRWIRGADAGPYAPKGFGVQVIEFHEQTEKRYLEFLELCLVDLKVSDVMDAACPTCLPTAAIAELVPLLKQTKAGCIVIIDGESMPMGIFTRSDLVRIVSDPGVLVSQVGRHMTPGPVTIDVEQSLDEAYVVLRSGLVEHLPVVDDEILVGLLSTRDLLRYWSELTDLQNKRMTRNYERAMSVIAHDLRTPIGIIQTSTQMLSSGQLSVQEFMDSGLPAIVESNCDMMLALIDDLLDLNKIKMGAIRLDCEMVDLEELARRVVAAFLPMASSKKIQLKIAVPMSVPRIKADPIRLEQVLNNLVSNALKFSPENGRVVVGLSPLHSKVALWVSDTGPGIQKEELGMLFSEYAPRRNRPTAGEKSTGLGLAIAKRLVEAHHGSISVETKPGIGTTFTVHLPIGDIQ